MDVILIWYCNSDVEKKKKKKEKNDAFNQWPLSTKTAVTSVGEIRNTWLVVQRIFCYLKTFSKQLQIRM